MFGGKTAQETLKLLQAKCAIDWILVVDHYPELDHDADLPQPASEISLLVISPDGDCLIRKETLGGHPDVLQPRIAKAGMAWLRQVLADHT